MMIILALSYTFLNPQLEKIHFISMILFGSTMRLEIYETYLERTFDKTRHTIVEHKASSIKIYDCQPISIAVLAKRK